MPKNFVFYNPERHQKIIHLLEQSGAKALIFANSDKSKMAGGMYPYPVIEDGDFDIPSVYIEGEKKDEIQMYVGQKVQLISRSKRIPSEGMNVIGRKGDNSKERIVITAHIDSKKGSPGAIDNASGITAQLLLAELLKGYKGKSMLEIVALNGEDYYSVPGQMKYISENREQFQDMLLNINIDGVGYKEGASSITYYQVTDEIGVKIKNAIKPEHGLVEGTPWPQGDHSIFIQKSVPAIAFTSNWLIDHLDEQDITHTDRDRLDVLDPEKIVRLAEGVGSIVMRISN
jgi:aminopeptidase YwaD